MSIPIYKCEPNGLRKCNRCGQQKALSEFSFVSKKGYPKNSLMYRGCKTCLHKKIVSLKREKMYGVSDEQYQRMLVAQDSRCAICGRKQEDLKASRGLAIDHDHATGKVRGLLCGKCNTAIGLFDDSTERMVAAIRYMEASNGSGRI